MNQQTGKNYRLPTEVEWEYAARGGKKGTYPWGTNQISCDQARYGNFKDECKNSDKTITVGSNAANGFGLHDTAGNVWEWGQGYYTASYDTAEQSGYYVLRGGAWDDISLGLRSALRYWKNPTNRSNAIGFRVSRTD
ncbi:formylglycine-generating enzyme family protein [uncultured Thiothrix sp.]|uniref:formylglycine-generating enzyme family protein n=1 Tax=uncultured Thiothrix sp. TaxID=223185 RepID=UPI00345CF024